MNRSSLRSREWYLIPSFGRSIKAFRTFVSLPKSRCVVSQNSQSRLLIPLLTSLRFPVFTPHPALFRAGPMPYVCPPAVGIVGPVGTSPCSSSDSF